MPARSAAIDSGDGNNKDNNTRISDAAIKDAADRMDRIDDDRYGKQHGKC